MDILNPLTDSNLQTAEVPSAKRRGGSSNTPFIIYVTKWIDLWGGIHSWGCYSFCISTIVISNNTLGA